MNYKAQLQAMKLSLGNWEKVQIREASDGTYTARFLLCDFPIVQMAALITDLCAVAEEVKADNGHNSGMYTMGGTPRVEIYVTAIPSDKGLRFKADVEELVRETKENEEGEE